MKGKRDKTRLPREQFGGGVEVQKVVVNRFKSIWQLVANGVLQGLVFVPVLLNNFTNDLDKVITYTLSQFAGGTKLGGSVGLLKGRKALDRLD